MKSFLVKRRPGFEADGLVEPVYVLRFGFCEDSSGDLQKTWLKVDIKNFFFDTCIIKYMYFQFFEQTYGFIPTAYYTNTYTFIPTACYTNTSQDND